MAHNKYPECKTCRHYSQEFFKAICTSPARLATASSLVSGHRGAFCERRVGTCGQEGRNYQKGRWYFFGY